jgi:hypothetical protein
LTFVAGKMTGMTGSGPGFADLKAQYNAAEGGGRRKISRGFTRKTRIRIRFGTDQPQISTDYTDQNFFVLIRVFRVNLRLIFCPGYM